MISLRALFPTILLLLVAVQQTKAFQIDPNVARTSHPTVQVSSNTQFDLISRPTTQISAKKNEEEPVRETKNAVELVILYMTPWRNPNSIFVYMFGALYFLGKYSEAKIASGGSL